MKRLLDKLEEEIKHEQELRFELGLGRVRGRDELKQEIKEQSKKVQDLKIKIIEKFK